MFKIIFLCSGNTCRSPMAEVLFKKHAKECGIDAEVKSAGVFAFSGDEASKNSKKVMKELGLSLENHRSKKLSVYDVEECDFIVPLTAQLAYAISGVEKSKIILPKKDIFDPYGKDENAYRICRDEIDAFTKELSLKLCETHIQPMMKEDVKFVARIEKECFSKPWSKDAILQELSNENACFSVAKKINKVCGYIGMHIILDECYITNIAVSPNFQNNHIGFALLEKAVADAKEKGCSFISLEVRKSNEKAISLYNKFGFSICGERKNFYTEPLEDALIMTKDF